MSKKLKIVMQTTYYHPHISGLTLYFQRLAEDLVALGHEVTVITARHDSDLEEEEIIKGVKVVRINPLIKINKGIIMPSIIWRSFNYIKHADVVHFNLPALESLPLSIIAKLTKTPIVTTYVCDITLPKFFLSDVLDKVTDIIHTWSLRLADKTASFTLDFAQNSRVMAPFSPTSQEVYPHVEIQEEKEQGIQLLEKNKSTPVIGMATRFAADKGIEFMLGAIPYLLKKYPKLKIAFAGNPSAIGEEKYKYMLNELFSQHEDRIILLGQLAPNQMPTFYRHLDVLVVSSTNSTEAFGMVQVEAMFEGTPVVATNLPGVRIPIQVTGMGEIAKIADSEDLAKQISKVLNSPKKYIQSVGKLKDIFNNKSTVKRYLQIYTDAMQPKTAK